MQQSPGFFLSIPPIVLSYYLLCSQVSQVKGRSVAGALPFRRRSSFFCPPATEIGLLCFPASQAGRFLGACDATHPHLPRKMSPPATLKKTNVHRHQPSISILLVTICRGFHPPHPWLLFPPSRLVLPHRGL